jgi:hypothetical protein
MFLSFLILRMGLLCPALSMAARIIKFEAKSKRAEVGACELGVGYVDEC